MRSREIVTYSLLDFLKACLHFPKVDLEEFIVDIIVPALLPFGMRNLLIWV